MAYDIASGFSLSASGRYLAVHGLKLDSIWQRVSIWDLERTKLITADACSGTYSRFVQFHPRDDVLVVLGDDLARISPLEKSNSRRRISPGVAARADSMATSTDGRIVAIGDENGAIHMIDYLSGQTLAVIQAGKPQSTMSFSLDNRFLVAPDSAISALVWDVRAILRNNGGSNPTTSVARLWEDLAAEDARIAYAAVYELSLKPAAALAYARARVAPIPRADMAEVHRFLEMVDSAKFADRVTAVAALKEVSDRASKALNQRIQESKLTAEAKAQFRRLIDHGLDPCASPDRRRFHRLITMCESINSPVSWALVKEIASGDPAALATQEAQRALRSN